MEVTQVHLNDDLSKLTGWYDGISNKPQLIFAFGSPDFFATQNEFSKFAQSLPKETALIGCSTAGEITDDGVYDNSIVLSALSFDKNPDLRSVHAELTSDDGGLTSGKKIGAQLKDPNLKAISVFGQGLNIDGSQLIEGIISEVGHEVIITGGLAGDNGAFAKTWTVLGGEISSNNVVAVGFFGDTVKFAYGSKGGWKDFGPVRKVTKAKANVLFELDGQPALEVYKKYLGDKASELPAAGLLFPFAILKDDTSTTGIIRTILDVNESEGSLTFAGDIPQNGLLRLMHAENSGLISGAQDAAKLTNSMAEVSGNSFGLLISCVGRKLVMADDIDEEIDAIKESFGDETTLSGFYSYGEICPFQGAFDCKLHNQTMTITRIFE